MQLGSLRLIHLTRVPSFIARPLVNFIADVTGREDIRFNTHGELYLVHPVDCVKWVIRYLKK